MKKFYYKHKIKLGFTGIITYLVFLVLSTIGIEVGVLKQPYKLYVGIVLISPLIIGVIFAIREGWKVSKDIDNSRKY